MKLAAAALSFVLFVPGLAQSQAPAPPYLLDPGELPPPTSTPGTWPATDGSDVGLNRPVCRGHARPAYGGPYTINTNGTTIEHVTLNQRLTINADNVTVNCVEITTGAGEQNGILVNASANGTTIRNNYIHNINLTGDHAGKAIKFEYATNSLVEWNNIEQAEDLIQADGWGLTIQNNWLHNVLTNAPGGPDLHSDGIAVQTGYDVLITHNRMDGFAGKSLGTIMVQPSCGGNPCGCANNVNNIDIIENYLDNDGYGNVVLIDHNYCRPGGAGLPVASCSTGMDIRGNRFGPLAITPSTLPPPDNSAWSFTFGGGGSSGDECPKPATLGGTCIDNLSYLGGVLTFDCK